MLFASTGTQNCRYNEFLSYARELRYDLSAMSWEEQYDLMYKYTNLMSENAAQWRLMTEWHSVQEIEESGRLHNLGVSASSE